MSDLHLRRAVIKLARENPDLRADLLPLLKKTAAASFWVGQFKQLDKAFPRYNPEKVADFNKVMKHYRASGLSGRDSGTPAHWYQEYRGGSLSLEQAAAAVAKELPGAERLLG